MTSHSQRLVNESVSQLEDSVVKYSVNTVIVLFVFKQTFVAVYIFESRKCVKCIYSSYKLSS